MSRYTVFDAETLLSIRTFSASDLVNASLQSNAPNEIIVEGHWPVGAFELAIDVRTHFLGEPVAVAAPEEPAPTKAMLDQFKQRLLRGTDWIYTRERETGQPPPAELVALRAAQRAAADRLEAMTPIPSNFRDPAFWPVEDNL